MSLRLRINGSLWLLMLLLFTLLSGCSTPPRAPVVSREGVSTQPVTKQYSPSPRSSKASSRPSFYTVKRGDSLYGISWQYGLEYRQLAQWNGIRSPYRIKPGQRLRLKSPAANNPKKKSSSSSSGRSSRPAVHTVRRGETLGKIASRYGLSYQKIASWNGIRSPYRVYPGQRLRLKASTTSSVQSRTASRIHTVKRGDTLGEIASRYGLSYQQIARLNNIRSPYRIYTGQRLRVSGKSSGSSGTKTVKPTKYKSAGSKRSTASSRSSGSSRSSSDGQKLKLRWLWPTKGTVVQRFSSRDPSKKGIKIGGKLGQRVLAAESGRVVYAGSGLIGYGRLIIIKHNKNYLSAYGHNQKILVKEGDQVKKGSKLAEMGSESRNKPRLHFEIRRNGKPVDPLRLLPRR
ncbi:MAG: LysM peptidoglycan-binding domain-containing protein [Gammaproteobacteria bacterium]|nr:LysM peptidoglycan-binding domain-containing protein [Gammaproteobacteria bacterium]